MLQGKTTGGALISALFITALAAIIATALSVQVHLAVQEGTLMMASDNAYFALQGMQATQAEIVKEYAAQWQDDPNDVEIQPLVIKMKPLTISGYQISGTLENAQGKFNINDLVSENNETFFANLLMLVMPSIERSQAMTLAASIHHWIATGADDEYYAKLKPPYRSPQAQLVLISELQKVRGMTPDIYQAVSPYLTALPVQTTEGQGSTVTPVDINSVSKPVLMALNPELRPEQAESMLLCRQSIGVFSSVEAFTQRCVHPSGVEAVSHIATQSHYFVTHAELSQNETVLSLESLVMTVTGKENTLKTVIVWQSFE